MNHVLADGCQFIRQQRVQCPQEFFIPFHRCHLRKCVGRVIHPKYSVHIYHSAKIFRTFPPILGGKAERTAKTMQSFFRHGICRCLSGFRVMFAPSPLDEVDDGFSVLSSGRCWGGTSPLIRFRLLRSGTRCGPTFLTLKGCGEIRAGSNPAFGTNVILKGISA